MCLYTIIYCVALSSLILFSWYDSECNTISVYSPSTYYSLHVHINTYNALRHNLLLFFKILGKAYTASIYKE